MAVVSGSRQTLSGDRAALGSRARLQGVKERKADRLLKLGVAIDLDIGPIPEIIEIRALLGDEPVPARVPRLGQRRRDLVTDRRHRAPPRPPVGEELDEPQRLAGGDVGADA